MIVGVKHDGHLDLALVLSALDILRGQFRGTDGRHQKGCKHCDNGNDDEQLNQGKGTLASKLHEKNVTSTTVFSHPEWSVNSYTTEGK
jgi:hypothetical protein